MKRILTLFCVALVGMMAFTPQAMADDDDDYDSRRLDVTRAEWRSDGRTLEVRAVDSSSRNRLTAIYNGQSYTMRYDDDDKRYELRVSSVCYADKVIVESSSGASVTEPVSDRDGRGDRYACTPTTPTPPPSGINVTRSEWDGERQRLDVMAETESRSGGNLTVLYNGVSYDMRYNSDRRRYELRLEPICYADKIAIQSSLGGTAAASVEDPKRMAFSSPCVVENPPPGGGGGDCPDNDGDGYPDAGCGGTDCNDNDPTIYPGAPEICFDGIDQGCTGVPDQGCTIGGGSGPHASLTYAQYPTNCLSCHSDKAAEVMQSGHYTWLGDAPDMVNGVGLKQGKRNAVNSYCVAILGDWPVCGSCHIGRGKQPDDPTANLANVDCLACHSTEYATKRERLADGSMGVLTPTDAMVRNVGTPDRAACLSCHAKAGGGDAVKRGDLSLALAANTNPDFDVHMNTAGRNVNCQSCHVFTNHRTIGKGSDLRHTDDPIRGSRIDCTTCHTTKAASNGHSTSQINSHVARVSCQVCHIPTYAKQATEIHRDWRRHADGSPADGVSGPGHPFAEKAANLVPEYMFWTGKSDNSLLGDDASRTLNPATGNYMTSKPIGGINDANSKIYPFKYKTAATPMTDFGSQLIAVDTFEYLKGSGSIIPAIESGLVNMGLRATEPYTWVTTETYQMINHGVNPSSTSLTCTDCHGSTSRINLKGEMGYQLKAASTVVCAQCHSRETPSTFQREHDRHVRNEGRDCSWCHNFSRPERGLRRP